MKINDQHTKIILLFSVLFIFVFTSGCAVKYKHTLQKTRTVQYKVPIKTQVKEKTKKPIAKQYEVREYQIVEPNVRVDKTASIIPPDWLASVPFRPKRHFGPFAQGSEIENIQVYLNGKLNVGGTGPAQTTVNWHYNDFFNQVDSDAVDIYRLYFRTNFTDPPHTGSLPTSQTPALSHVPGWAPTVSSGQYAANDVLFCLKQISHSSRFGGSLKLKMSLCDIPTPNNQNTSIEDFEYEFSNNQYKFDVNDMDMNIYVNPIANLFNPKANYSYQVSIHVELIPNDFIAYRLPDGEVVNSETARQNLVQILNEFSKIIATKLGKTGTRPPASIFTHAWIHNQHQERIGDNDKVTQIVISDGFSDVWTEQYEPYLWVVWQVFEIDNSNSAHLRELRNEYEIDLSVHHVTGNGRFEVLNSKIEVTETDDNIFGTTHWYNITGMPVDQCNSINHIELKSVITEKDFIDDDDSYDIVYNDLFLECNQINRQAQQSWYVGWVDYGIINDTTHRDFRDNGVLEVYTDVTEGDNPAALEYVWRVRVGIFAR